jgi:hypothetical protein
MKIKTLLIALILGPGTVFCQDLPEEPTTRDIRSWNKTKLMTIDIGMDKAKVLELMGGVKNIQSYTIKTTRCSPNKEVTTTSKDDVINNPFQRDLTKDKDGNTIEILWYYTDKYKSDGIITKDELTPIVLENNIVIIIGWNFYTDYAKKKGID